MYDHTAICIWALTPLAPGTVTRTACTVQLWEECLSSHSAAVALLRRS